MNRVARWLLSFPVRTRTPKPITRTKPARKLGVEPLEERVVPDGRPLPNPLIFVGSAAGTPVISAYRADTGELSFSRAVYDPSFTGGVRVAAADFTGDG